MQDNLTIHLMMCYSEKLTVILILYALYVIRISSINAIHVIRCVKLQYIKI